MRRTKRIDVTILPDGMFRVTIGTDSYKLNDREMGRLADYSIYALQEKEVMNEENKKEHAKRKA